MTHSFNSRIAVALALFGAFAVLAPGVSLAVPIVVETGSRTTAPGEGLIGTEAWGSGGLIIQWEITFDDDTDLWGYQYTFLDDDPSAPNGAPSPELSHWILELSASITTDNIDELILSPNFAVDPDAPKTYGEAQGNPGMPADIYGMKTDTGTSDTFNVYTFLSPRAPMWGDVYAKDGGGNGAGSVHAYNVGFGTDPTSSTTDFTNWIRVPDTTNGQGQAPEPGTLLLIGAGLLALSRRRRA